MCQTLSLTINTGRWLIIAVAKERYKYSLFVCERSIVVVCDIHFQKFNIYMAYVLSQLIGISGIKKRFSSQKFSMF